MPACAVAFSKSWPTSTRIPPVSTLAHVTVPSMLDAMALPKAELHLHIEGTLEPEMMFALAARNGIPCRSPSVDAVRRAYEFTDLQSFLDIYYAGCGGAAHRAGLLRPHAGPTCERAAADRTCATRRSSSTPRPTPRGESRWDRHGGHRPAPGATPRRELGITSQLILCFLRHLTERGRAGDALSRPSRSGTDSPAVGLDSSERGNPPERFVRVFARARAEGLQVVAHAGEEGPPTYIRQALDLLGAERIDHGVRCVEDRALVARLVA